MKKLGDQWVEIIDGQEHMVKEVSALSYGDCNGCFMFTVAGCGKVTDFAPCSSDTIIKDLGILKDGRLPCPFCGEYPTIKSGQDSDGWSYVELVCGNYLHRMTGYLSDLEAYKQQLIDAWNRRA